MKNNGWITFVAGALVGAGLTWLFASKEGKELREKLKSKGEDLKDEVQQEWEALKKQVDTLKKDLNT
jgi:gas vesicle protein